MRQVNERKMTGSLISGFLALEALKSPARFGASGKLFNGKCKHRATEEGLRQANESTEPQRKG